MMTMEKTIRVSADRKVHFDLEMPEGWQNSEIVVSMMNPQTITHNSVVNATIRRVDRTEQTQSESVEESDWSDLIGIFKDSAFSSEKLFEERRRDDAMDEASYRRFEEESAQFRQDEERAAS
jgi:hypothetical protein